MVRRLRVVWGAVAVALLCSCGGPETDFGPDAGADASSGAGDADQVLPASDAGAGADAAAAEDAGPPADGGQPADDDAGSVPDAGEGADAARSEPDAANVADASEVTDASRPEPDAAIAPDAGGLPDAARPASDAGGGIDAGRPPQDAGDLATPDGGDPHAGADKLEYCGSSPSLPAGRGFTVTLNGQAIDFVGGYFWGAYSPETPLYWGDSTFTWVSADGQYYLELVVRQGFLGSCPVTLSLPNEEVVWNLYDGNQPPAVDLYSSDVGASGALKLDAYDLAGGACWVSVECESCRLVWESDVAVIDGTAFESCL